MKYNISPNEAKIWGVHGAMDAMPDYNTSSPAGMELAQLTEVVSCNKTVTQKTTVQMQIQSMTGPCSRIFLLLLIKILSSLYLFISWIPPSLHTKSIPHREKRHSWELVFEKTQDWCLECFTAISHTWVWDWVSVGYRCSCSSHLYQPAAKKVPRNEALLLTH